MHVKPIFDWNVFSFQKYFFHRKFSKNVPSIGWVGDLVKMRGVLAAELASCGVAAGPQLGSWRPPAAGQVTPPPPPVLFRGSQLHFAQWQLNTTQYFALNNQLLTFKHFSDCTDPLKTRIFLLSYKFILIQSLSIHYRCTARPERDITLWNTNNKTYQASSPQYHSGPCRQHNHT